MGGERGHGYSTENERAYILGLVTGTNHHSSQRSDRVSSEQLLRNYIASAERRRKWDTFGGVDAKVVIEYAKGHLERLERLEATSGDGYEVQEELTDADA